MYIALDLLGNTVEAEDAKKENQYFCPVCNSEMQLKQGNIKKRHFSHVNIMMCERHLYRRESSLHLKLKHDLYLKLRQSHSVKMECYLERIEQIPDLLINDKYALEIQLSKIAPRIILERTKGFFEEGIQVTWLHDDKELKIKRNILSLTQFHYSTLNHFVLFSIDDGLNIYRYRLQENIYQNKWTYKKERVYDDELFQPVFNSVEIVKRRPIDIHNEIQKERHARNYLNPTLTYLYQLRLNETQLPVFLTYLTPSERFINNNPLEWKLYLYHSILTGSYDRKAFISFINFRPIFKLDKNGVVQNLLKEFKEIFRKTN